MNLIVGTGKLGKQLFDHVSKHDDKDTWTLSRTHIDFNSNHIIADLLTDNLDEVSFPHITTLYILLAPDSRDKESYQRTYIQASCNIVRQLQSTNPKLHTIFVSSTSVYESQQGLLTEETLPTPNNFKGKALLKAELALFNLCDTLSIVRPSGLYSKQRLGFINAISKMPIKNSISDTGAPKWYNVIHESDLCRILFETSRTKLPLQIASDSKPFTAKQYQQLSQYPVQNIKDSNRRFASLYLDYNELIFHSIFDWKS